MNDQDKREKVIKGLESELLYVNDYGDCTATKSDCPYAGIDCHNDLIRDAIALLKAQEPVKPILDLRAIEFYRCGQCNEPIDRCDNYCWSCGRAVKWQ